MTNGIDISNFNHPLNIAKVQGRPQFVIAKATEGTDFIDGAFPGFAEQSSALKIPHFGAYHFFHAENLNARAQADFFIKHAQPRSGWSLWVDYETYGASGQEDAEEIGYFTDEIRVHFPLAKVGIYCNTVGYDRISPWLSEINFSGLWYANPSIPMTGTVQGINWIIHQYATSSANVDQDYWKWDIPVIQEYYDWNS